MLAGPRTRQQMLRLGSMWKQGEHVLINGATGSGKTALARKVLEQRERRGAHVIVFCMKTKKDDTITDMYLKDGYTKYTKWPKRGFPSWESRVVMWPDVSKARGKYKDIIDIQKEVLGETFAKIIEQGNRTVLFDDGLYLTHPQFLGMSGELAMAHAMGRSDDITCITNAQRPADLPLIVYGSADHALVGTVREKADMDRLAKLQADEPARALGEKISRQGKHDFLWIPARHGGPAEPVNLRV